MDTGKREENRKKKVNDGWMCVCVRIERERGVCEGTIKALYNKSPTVRVCVEITEGRLSPFWLCQDDACIPFFLPVKYYRGAQCVISGSMRPTCLVILHLLSALT